MCIGVSPVRAENTGESSFGGLPGNVGTRLKEPRRIGLPRPDGAVKGTGEIPLGKRHYYLGMSGIRSSRWGYFEFEDPDLLQDTTRSPASMWGIRFGGRYPLNDIFRAQFGLQANFGSLTVDTLLNSELLPVAEEYSVFHFGVIPQIQILLPPVGVTQLHAGLGIGFNVVRYDEPEDRQLTGLTDRRWCMSAHGGVGFDIWASESFGLTLSYSQTVWRPVFYHYKIQLPESSIPYWEIHWTHTVGAALMFLIDG